MRNRPKRNNHFVFVILLLFGFCNPLFSQNSNQQLLTKSDSLNQQYPQEKIYLHLDRPSYWAGDDIWFKAYLKNTAIPKSNVYVELLDSAGTVIYKDICWAMNGFAYDDFHLEDTISSGMYQLRAYTSWMRNFDEQWFFRRDLVIWNLRDKQHAPEVQKLKTRNVNINFMPESGTFLAGIKNRVAFKVTDENGKGLDVEGVIIDDKRNPVAEIESGYKGMGSFEIAPQPGMKYTAEVTIAGNIPKGVNLPVAAETGVAMRLNPENTTQIHFEIREQFNNENNTDNLFYFLTGQTEGKVCYNEEIKITDGKADLTISKDNFPTGIVRFTLFTSDMIPKCERLVFVNHHDQINVTITPNKQILKPRELITLDLIALGSDNSPAYSNLSLSAYHVETTGEVKTYPENIMTQFLLSSELKGRIEEPAYYFKDDSLSTLTALDNLMLTHGYRYFSWEEVIENKQPEITFQPDSSIELKGKIVSLLTRRPISKAKLTIITVNSQLMVNEQKTDSEGNFKFPNLYFYDSLDVVVQALNRNGRKSTDVILDDKVYVSPKTEIFPSLYSYKKENSATTVTYLSEISPELINRKWRLSDTILLQEINVAARKIMPVDEEPKPYLEPDHVINVRRIKDEFADVSDMLNSSGYYRNFANRGFEIYIDGVPDFMDRFSEFPLSWIDKIEFVKVGPVPGGWGPAMYVWTVRGAPNERVKAPPAITTVKLKGYSVSRNFYSPVYDGSEEQKGKKDDFRSTLYWNPVIETNSTGIATVSFYNSDQTGEVKIVVEGVTYDGKLCRGIGSYNVNY